MKNMPCFSCFNRQVLLWLLVVPGTALLPTIAQSSQNVVGYINYLVPENTYCLLSNQLNTTNNTLNGMLLGQPQGSRMYTWDVTNQVFLEPSIYDADSGTWSTNYPIPVGKGWFFHSPAATTITFVGEVRQGTLTNFVAGTNKLTLLGSIVPQAGGLQTVLGFPSDDGDNVYQYAGQYSEAKTYYAPHGWYPSEPDIRVGEGFFVRHRGPDKLWVRNFTVAPRANTTIPVETEPQPSIENYSIRDGTVTLKIKKTARRYNVQFSTDRVNWTNIAVNQTATTWKGKLPPEPTGFFQVVNP